MLRLTLRSMWAHKRRLVGMCSAVVLGVAFLAGTLVLGDTMRAGFGGLFAEANAGTDAVVRGADEFGSEGAAERGLVDAALVEELRGLDGVAAAEPYVEGAGQVIGADGEPLGGEGPPTVAAGWIDDAELNPYRVAEGRVPERAGEVVIDRRSSERGDLPVGATTTVLVPEPVEVEVVGVVTFAEEDSLSGATFAAFTPAEAQRLLLGGTDQVSSVLVRGTDGVSQDELAERIAGILPPQLEAITGEALTDEQVDQIGADFLDFFETFLLVFTGVALIVATFSIYNTFSVIVAQRTREAALLRAIGASRGQVLRSTVGEAAVIGLLASTLGVAAGIGLAVLLSGALESMVGSVAEDLEIDLGRLAWAALLGVAVTLVAAVAPAVRSSRVPALAAMREVAVDRSGTSRWRAVVGGLTLLAGVGLIVASTTAADGSAALSQAGLGAVLCLAGMVVVGPVVARLASLVIGAPLAAGRGFVGELARNNAMRDPKRTASTASALMVGVGVVTLFTVFGASIKASLADSVDRSFGGDLVVRSESWSGSGLSREMTGELAALPEVEHSAGVGFGAAELDGDEEEFAVIDPGPLDAVLDLGETDGELADLDERTFAVAAARAEDEGWAVGTEVPVRFADGEATTWTVGVVYESRDLMGDVMVPDAAWTSHTGKRTEDFVLVSFADGVDLADGRRAVEAVVDGYGAGALVEDRDQYVDSIGAEVDGFLALVYILLAVSVIIALMGIANTLSLSIHERTRELGLLRAVGQTRRQLRAMVRGESLIVSLFGTIGGIGLGLFLGWGLVQALAAAEGIGSYAVPVGPLVVVLAVGGAVGLLAALRPARRAAKLDVLAALAHD